MAEAAAAGKRGPCCTLGSLAELRQVAMALAGGWAAAATEKGRAVVTVPMAHGWPARAAGDQDRRVELVEQVRLTAACLAFDRVDPVLLLELLRDTRGVLLEPLTPACHAYM